MRTNTRFQTRRLVTVAMFCALAYVVTLVFHIKVNFLTFDAKDAVTCIAAMLLGPGAGAAIAMVVATVESISISDTAFWGWLMNFASTAVFSVTASVIYRRYKKMWSAVLGLIVAVVATTACMLVLNILVTPIYMKVERELVLDLLPKLLFPFNLLKTTLNASLVMIFYKPLSAALKRARVLPSGEQGETSGYRWLSRRSILFMTGALLLAAACIACLVWMLGGSFSLFD